MCYFHRTVKITSGVKVMASEREIIEQLRVEWSTLLPQVRLLRVAEQVPGDTPGKPRYDLVLDVQIGDVRRQLICEVKSVGEPRYLHQAISELKMAVADREGRTPTVIAPYISEEGRGLCRQAGVNYIDLTGNVLLRFDHVLIDKTSGGKPPSRKRAYPNVFAPRSSRVLRVFLENVGRAWTLAALAEESQVSVGLAHRVVGVLADKGYVDKKRGAISPLKPGELLDLWAEKHDVALGDGQRYHSFQRTFPAFAEDLKSLAEREDLTYAFTLHAGASLVAPFVRFTDVHFYCQADPEMLIEGLDLRPVEAGGTIHVLKPYDRGVFYKAQERDGLSVVCNIQLYLDLINYPASGREQAQFLRQQKIGF